MKNTKYVRIAGKIILWTFAVLFVLMAVLQLILISPLPTKVINRMADALVDGEMSFGKVEVSIMKRFPNIGVSLKDFSITYPSDRFDESEKAGVQGLLMWRGCAEEADTLASFDRFSAYMNIFRLAAGTIKVKEIEMIKPRFFLHKYADGASNLDILKFISTDEQEAETTLPPMLIGKMDFEERPVIVYTDCNDTLFAQINLRHLNFDGLIDTKDFSHSKIGFNLDSMSVAGRLGRDTLALRVDRFRIEEHEKHLELSAMAKTFAATRTYGRMMIPVGIQAGFSFPQDSVTAVSVSHFDLDVASIKLHGSSDVRFHKDSLWTDSRIMIHECSLDSLLKQIVRPFIPETEKISTDALLSAEVMVKGGYVYESGRIPELKINLKIPNSEIIHSDLPKSVELSLDASAGTDERRKINASINNVEINTAGLGLFAKGSIQDVLADDPRMGIDGRFKADLSALAANFIPDSLGIIAKGSMEGKIRGNARLSQLNIYRFSQATLEGEACCQGLEVSSPSDSVYMMVNDLDMNIGPEIRSRRNDASQKIRLLAVTGKVDSTYIRYKNSFEVKGQDVTLTMKNSSNSKGTIDSTAINPLSFSVIAKTLSIKDAVSTSIALNETENRVILLPKKEHKEIPVMRVTSRNKRIFFKSTANRAILTDANIKVMAGMNTVERKQRLAARLDSLAKVYPDIPRDSLFAHARAMRQTKEVEAWMKEQDFVKKDPDLRLDQAFAKYYREWDLDGSMNVRTGILMTPYFPLRNLLKGCYVSFDNDRITIDSLGFASGESRMAAKGSLTGIRRTLLGRRNSMLNLDVDITSDGMNANELLRAYSAGSNYVAPESGKLEDVSDSEFLKMVTSEGAKEQENEAALIVVPGNIKADISFDASNIIYSDLIVEKATSRLLMKERCIQMTDTKAITNAGEISMDAFYSTRSKKELKTGFDINFKDITAEKVIALMPAVDSLLPMLKSFRGLLNCEVAATSDLDTNMNIVMPSINGVMRIHGDDLTISDSEMFTALAKKLMFKNKTTGFIDNMTVEGIIRNNTLEVFPFVLQMDRYTLAMSGLQNLDMSFKYHVSVLKSPFLFRIGINLTGDDFDNMKFRIGKALYKNTNVPVFTSVIDDTKINLLNSIRGIFEKGVEAALAESEKQQEIIEQEKDKLGFENAANMELEPLSEKEQKQMEAEAEAEEAAEKAAENAAETTAENTGQSGTSEEMTNEE